MAINIITSNHNLERDVTPEILAGAPHVVRCLTCKVGPLSLDEAAEHAEQPLPKKTIGEPQTFRLFTLFP